MEEINFNETAVEETAESEKALNCDSNEPKKSKTPAMFKAGIALMCATSALSLGAIGACGFLGYKLYKNQKNQDANQQDSMGSVVANKNDLTISEDGYIVYKGVKTSIKMPDVSNGEDGEAGISVVNASIVNLDKWGITTQFQFKMSDNSYIVTAPQTQVLSEHFYEAEDMSDILTLTEGYGVSKIKLSKNVYLTSSIEFAGDTVIDLNRKTLDYVAVNPLKVAENSTLTFKNGSVNFKNSVGVSVQGENAELSFEKVTVGATSTVAETLEKYFIVRIAWVFGRNGNNFIKTMLNIGKKYETLRVVNDQIGTPTYTLDLSRLLVDMVETEKYGYYHATNEGGYISWYDFACEIFRQAGYTNTVLPVTTEEYGLSKAKRPFNSRLDKQKLIDSGFTPLPDWQDALSRYLKEV